MQSAELQIMVHRVKCDFLSRKMDPQKLESDLTNRFLVALILEAVVRLIMVSSVKVIFFPLLFLTTYYFLTRLMFALYCYIFLISVTDDLCLFVFQLILCASMVQDGKIELNSHLM